MGGKWIQSPAEHHCPPRLPADRGARGETAVHPWCICPDRVKIHEFLPVQLRHEVMIFWKFHGQCMHPLARSYINSDPLHDGPSV